jgi:hypothetical protein
MSVICYTDWNAVEESRKRDRIILDSRLSKMTPGERLEDERLSKEADKKVYGILGIFLIVSFILFVTFLIWALC